MTVAVDALDDESIKIAFRGMEELQRSIELIHAYVAVIILKRAGALP